MTMQRTPCKVDATAQMLKKSSAMRESITPISAKEKFYPVPSTSLPVA